MKRFPPKNKSINSARRTFLAMSLATCWWLGTAASARDLQPEITSRVWLENDSVVAAVSLNGKDLITFRSKAGSDAAAEEAEDLASRLQEVVTDKDFDPNQLLPARDGDKAAIRVGTQTVLSFDPLVKKADETQQGLDQSVKLVNGLRIALGAPSLPSTFPVLSDRATLASRELKGQSFSGRASWYGPKFHGRLTSDGSRFDMEKLTAAHRSLPFGTKLLVMNRKTGNSCVVEINDRGPFIAGRVIDLSKAAARQLNMLGSGVAMVDCLVLGN